ncbi:hypothetical protein KOR42_31990 [Thalassoglobus neptunius]|uniref:Uncharacterized protein n=2 Tax=Thalassoglobus neptunius TaxID=1938619 RepID=A0A5C5WMS1_9PLAN|nr:hypothetical protein KOR42_31990 [Thalassoglobus neptunius]
MGHKVNIHVTLDDFGTVVSGNEITKVIYLPDGETNSLETLVSTRIDPELDALDEANRFGQAVISMQFRPHKPDQAGTPPFNANNASAEQQSFVFPTSETLIQHLIRSTRAHDHSALTAIFNDHLIRLMLGDALDRVRVELFGMPGKWTERQKRLAGIVRSHDKDIAVSDDDRLVLEGYLPQLLDPEQNRVDYADWIPRHVQAPRRLLAKIWQWEEESSGEVLPQHNYRVFQPVNGKATAMSEDGSSAYLLEQVGAVIPASSRPVGIPVYPGSRHFKSVTESPQDQKAWLVTNIWSGGEVGIQSRLHNWPAGFPKRDGDEGKPIQVNSDIPAKAIIPSASRSQNTAEEPSEAVKIMMKALQGTWDIQSMSSGNVDVITITGDHLQGDDDIVTFAITLKETKPYWTVELTPVWTETQLVKMQDEFWQADSDPPPSVKSMIEDLLQEASPGTLKGIIRQQGDQFVLSTVEGAGSGLPRSFAVRNGHDVCKLSRTPIQWGANKHGNVTVCLSRRLARNLQLDDEKLKAIDELLDKLWKQFVTAELEHTTYSRGHRGQLIAEIRDYGEQRRLLESQFRYEISRLVSGRQREALLSAIQNLRGHKEVDDIFKVDSNAYPSLWGWNEQDYPVRIEISANDSQLHWYVKPGKHGVTDDGPMMPRELKHYLILGQAVVDEQLDAKDALKKLHAKPEETEVDSTD